MRTSLTLVLVCLLLASVLGPLWRQTPDDGRDVPALPDFGFAPMVANPPEWGAYAPASIRREALVALHKHYAESGKPSDWLQIEGKMFASRSLYADFPARISTRYTKDGRLGYSYQTSSLNGIHGLWDPKTGVFEELPLKDITRTVSAQR